MDHTHPGGDTTRRDDMRTTTTTTTTIAACAALGALAVTRANAAGLAFEDAFDDGALSGWVESKDAKYGGA